MSDDTGTASNSTVLSLSHRFELLQTREPRKDLAFVRVEPSRTVELLTHLRDRHGYAHLVFLTAVDYIEEEVFRLTYLVHNYGEGMDVGVETDIPREAPRAETISHLWAQAATYERELAEMFGIDFPGSPRVNEPFILESWRDIPPMRRDFDTKEYSLRTYFHRPAPVFGAAADDGEGERS